MVGWLSAFVAVLTVLCLGDLLLTFAVLRRLRVHEERLASMVFPGPDLSAVIGRRLPGLTASGNDGESIFPVANAAGERLVGLFSAGCGACVEQAREFARLSEPDRVAVVVWERADPDEQQELLAALEGSPAIVSEPVSRRIVDELGLGTFPVLLRVDESGVVARAEHSLASLAVPAAGAR